MRYLANRPLHIKFPGQDAVDYKPGDELVDFGTWPFHLQERFLENRMVRSVSGDGDSVLTSKEVEGVRRLLQATATGKLMGVPLVHDVGADALGHEAEMPVSPKDFATKRAGKTGR